MNRMDQDLVRISKFLSLVLRHKPETVGLSLDAAGWVEVERLIAAAQRAGVRLDRDVLHAVLAHNDKQRFSLSTDGLRIRANQGHSLPIELGLKPLAPPELLFHGTATRFVESIERQGLRAGKRTHVHLSPDEHTATAVGKRHGKPFVLTIQAARMHERGFDFYRSDNGVWLTKTVPVEYIVFPAS
jgi:putative RNA 2'-phosphotransferase